MLSYGLHLSVLAVFLNDGPFWYCLLVLVNLLRIFTAFYRTDGRDKTKERY